jgi:hypothetical protein
VPKVKIEGIVYHLDREFKAALEAAVLDHSRRTIRSEPTL